MRKIFCILMTFGVISLISGEVRTVCAAPRIFPEFELSSSEPLSLNHTVTLTLKIKAPESGMPNLKLQIFLPAGFNLIQGELTWEGDLKGDEVLVLKSEVMAISKGTWVIEAVAFGKNETGEYSVLKGCSLPAPVGKIKSMDQKTKEKIIVKRLKTAVDKILSSQPPGGYAAIPRGVRSLNVRVKGNKILINLSKELLLKGTGSDMEDAIHQILSPLSDVVPEIKNPEYIIYVEGVSLHKYLNQ